MADTDVIKALAADGKTTLTLTRAALAKNIEFWVWAHDRGLSVVGQVSNTMTDDLRLALVAIKAGSGNAQQ